MKLNKVDIKEVNAELKATQRIIKESDKMIDVGKLLIEIDRLNNTHTLDNEGQED